MFYVLNETNSPKTHRVNTSRIAHIASAPSPEPGRILAEIQFTGGASLNLTLDQTVWEKFTAFLHDLRRVT
jgi:hypothetical protein